MIRTRADGSQVPVAADPFALPRDRATDQSGFDERASLGLELDPGLNLGAQVADPRRFLSRTRRPARFQEGRVLVQGRDLTEAMPRYVGPGTISRNIRYPNKGIASPGFFSWAANAPDLPPAGRSAAALEPSRVDEYYLSSTHLQLPDSDPTVVSETERPQPGLAPFQSRPTVQAQASSGYPVLQPSIPSYGSRIPLRRPRTLGG